MKITCTIEMDGVRSLTAFTRELLIMIENYNDMNEDAKVIYFTDIKEVKED